jgi:hypothetical protein
MKYYIGLFILLNGCAVVPHNDPREIRSTDQSLTPYIQDFESYYGKSIDVPIGFKALTYPAVGMCTIWSTGEKEIQIDPVYWSYIEHTEQTALVFHELGHCVLGRGHISTMMSTDKLGDLPISLMYSYVFYNPIVAAAGLWPHYVDELFTISKMPTPSASTDLINLSIISDGCIILKENKR